MDLQDTLEQYVLQLKNTETRTLEAVVSVCRKMMSTLYDHYFSGAEALRPGPTSRCPDSDILTLAWVLELIGKDSELAGYKLIKAQLGHLFPYLPERYSFPIPLCDFKRASAWTSPLKCADGTGTLATDRKCATKGFGTFLHGVRTRKHNIRQSFVRSMLN